MRHGAHRHPPRFARMKKAGERDFVNHGAHPITFENLQAPDLNLQFPDPAFQNPGLAFQAPGLAFQAPGL
jgi:hypothetical protein